MFKQAGAKSRIRFAAAFRIGFLIIVFHSGFVKRICMLIK